MARHRKIDIRIWGDAKFRKLSPPQPCGQFLWIYLLTGPHTTSIPGLIHVGEASLAEALGWNLKAFREAFKEALREGMLEADFSARVIWIPKAINYNPPESANVVKSWRTYWDEIPECKLKEKAYVVLLNTLEGFGKGFGKAFAEGCKQPTNLVRNTPSPNQEQEQEQEQDNTPLNPPRGGNDPILEISIPDSLNTPEFLEAWGEWHTHRKQKRKKLTQLAVEKQVKFLESIGVERGIKAIHFSIRNNWEGIFEEKGLANGKPAKTEEERNALWNAYKGTAK